MNSFDIIVMVIVVLCLVRGAFRGFVKEIASIVGVVAGFYGASVYYTMAGELLAPWIDAATYRELLGFFITFMGIRGGGGPWGQFASLFFKDCIAGMGGSVLWYDVWCRKGALGVRGNFYHCHHLYARPGELECHLSPFHHI